MRRQCEWAFFFLFSCSVADIPDRAATYAGDPARICPRCSDAKRSDLVFDGVMTSRLAPGAGSSSATASCPGPDPRTLGKYVAAA